MRLLLDEMYPTSLAEQLRARGHDVVSVHDPSHVHLRSLADEVVAAAALDEGRALVTENVPDFRRLAAAADKQHQPMPLLIHTTNERFPRARAGTLGRLVLALDTVLCAPETPAVSFFLEPPEQR